MRTEVPGIPTPSLVLTMEKLRHQMSWVEGATTLKTRAAVCAPHPQQHRRGVAVPALPCTARHQGRSPSSISKAHTRVCTLSVCALSNSAKSKANKCLCYWDPLSTATSVGPSPPWSCGPYWEGLFQMGSEK